MKFHKAQLDILMIVMFMPITDLSIIGLVLAILYGLTTSFFLVPYAFVDTFYLYHERLNKFKDPE